jgi:drug/metabolite transporter (DMT)-like permease
VSVLALPVAGAVLMSAALHASWNIMIRAGSDRRRETALFAAGCALLAGPALVFLPMPRSLAWINLAISAILHGFYFALIAEAYARGGVALAYPLMRGTAPMLTTLGAWALLSEHLPPTGWLGIATICGGVVVLARGRGAPGERAAAVFALLNAMVIALYTLNDAIGARASGAPVSYALWVDVLSAIPALLWFGRGLLLLPRRREVARAGGGALCSVIAYAVVLWAMTRAPVALVAALRETSMLFGIVLARAVLGERPGGRGWAAAAAIAAGAVLLRLA